MPKRLGSAPADRVQPSARFRVLACGHLPKCLSDNPPAPVCVISASLVFCSKDVRHVVLPAVVSDSLTSEFVCELQRGRESAASEQAHRVPVPFDCGESARTMCQRKSLKVVGRVDHLLGPALLKLRWSNFCSHCGLAPKMLEFVCPPLGAGKKRFRSKTHEAHSR